jgi:hypothetical protein
MSRSKRSWRVSQSAFPTRVIQLIVINDNFLSYSPIMQRLYGAAGGAPGGFPGAGGFPGGAPGGAPGGFPGASEDGPSVEEVD